MAGGPRVTTGEGSKQDYATPNDFMMAVEGRFGPPVFDLAAHAENKRCERYFGPPELIYQYDPAKDDPATVLRTLTRRGATAEDVKKALVGLPTVMPKGKKSIELVVKNSDQNALGLDAFIREWAPLSQTLRNLDGTPGLLWLNCEFSDIWPWAERCLVESKKGANITLLTPAMVGSNWYRDLMAGRADVYHLNGRLIFDGKNPYPKDCMLSHFHLGATGKLSVWDWRKDVICQEWASVRKAA